MTLIPKPHRILVATSNRGKLHDFAALAHLHGFEVHPIPGFSAIPQVVEDQETFEDNARKKASEYSRNPNAAGELVIADDSGLVVNALNGAPGVRSARYASDAGEAVADISMDEANNALLLRELHHTPASRRTAHFCCVIAAARNGKLLATFEGKVEGHIADAPRGFRGFGYDPLFVLPDGRTMAELSDEEKARTSHRARAFEKLLQWLTLTPRQKHR